VAYQTEVGTSEKEEGGCVEDGRQEDLLGTAGIFRVLFLLSGEDLTSDRLRNETCVKYGSR